MRTFPCFLMAALTLSACAVGNNEPQTIADDAAAQIVAECQEQALAPEFDLIRSRVNLSVTGADPAPFMLLSTELPTAGERIEIARWSEIRDSCFQRLMAVMDSTPFGVSQPLWQPMVRIFQQDGQSQHALLMALARGELTYGQFVQDSTRITARMYAAVEPFIREPEVQGQLAMAQADQYAADQNAEAVGAFVGSVLEIIGDFADAGAFSSGFHHHHGGGGHGGGSHGAGGHLSYARYR
jgi:hypothetical protein